MTDYRIPPSRCAGCDAARHGTAPGTLATERIWRRHYYKSAVFASPGGPSGEPGGEAGPGHPARGGDGATAEPALTPVTAGVVLDVTPHVLVLAEAGRESRITLSPGTVAWRGNLTEPTALRAGDRVVVRLRPDHQRVADKVWAEIGRVTGTIVEQESGSLLVDEGGTRRRQAVVISSLASTRIQVRFPQLTPGSLVDLIGLRRGRLLEALLPATSQPGYGAGRGDRVPAAAAAARAGTISGSATWSEPAGASAGASAGAGAEGVAYPAIDPGAGCPQVASAGPGCASLPYLALGSMLVVRNDCTGASALLPVTGCSAVAGLFCDRCVTCGNSPRARITELGPAGFVRLGGDLERGCFNATISIGR